MGISVLIPWRSGDRHREAILERLQQRYVDRHPDWQVVVGVCEDGPWVKAAAVQEGLARVTGEVLVVADADVWCDGIPEAVDNLTDWAIPHGKVHRLREGITTETDDPAALTQRPYVGYEGGGIVILPTDTYRQVPLDPGFQGWGQEDEAWALALRTLVGEPWRGDAPLWHWWHPPQERKSRHAGSRESMHLFRSYRRANGHPEAMAELIEEGRCRHQPASCSTSATSGRSSDPKKSAPT